MEHKLTITNRENIQLQGIEHIHSFNEKEIKMNTNMKTLIVKGNELHITHLDLNKKEIIIEGKITEVKYEPYHILKILDKWR